MKKTASQRKNKRTAREYFMKTYPELFASGQTIDLHHVDAGMKRRDPERYAQWNVRDLVPLTRSQHCRVHQAGNPQSKSELRKRRRRMGQTTELTRRHMRMLVECVAPDGTVRTFGTQRECAKALGVSRQQVWYVMSERREFAHYRRAAGHELRWVESTGEAAE